MRILPAGVPYGLSRFGQRVREAAANTPLFFIGAVIVIAVVFRVGIGAVKPAAAAEEVEEKPVPAKVGHVTVPSSMGSQQISGSASASAKPAAAASPAVGRDPAEAAPKPMVRGKKPRTHGKR